MSCFVNSRFTILALLLIGLAGVAACAGIAPEIQLAEEMVQKGNWDAAVAAYREALKNDPFNEELNAKYQETKAAAAQYHYAEGRKFLKAKQLPEALQEFQIALGLDPSNANHLAALGDAVRLKDAKTAFLDAEKLRKFGRMDEAMAAYERAIELDPSLTEAVEGLTSLVQDLESRKKVGGSSEPVTLRFQNTRLKQVFEILARTADINILFEKDVRDDLVTIFTKDTPFHEALNLILSTNKLFARQVAEDTLLIIPDTKQKRQQYQDLKIRTFYLSNAKAKDIANLLRTILETKRVYVNEPLNTVVVRAQPEKITLAEHIILANDQRDAEVVFDMEVLEVNRNKTRKLGLNFAKEAGAGFFPTPGGTLTGTIGAGSSFTMRELGSLGPESYLFTFPSSVLLSFFKSESDAKTLASPKLRVLNNQKASINIGDKQPILLSTTNVLPGQASTGGTGTTSTVTSIEFKDTGIKLDIEPTVHLTGDITLKLKVEVTRLGDLVRLQSDPVIEQFRFGTRTAETTLNMKDGETVILAGLIQEEDRQTRESVPGIEDWPIIKDLFFRQKDKIKTEVILAITPRLVRSVNPPNIVKQTLWSGTADQYATHPLFSEQEPASIEALETKEPASAPIPEPTGGPAPAGEKTAQAQPTPGPPPTQNTQAPGRIFISPLSLSTKVGQTFRLSLMAQNLPMGSSQQVNLSYNPTQLEFLRVNGPENQAPGQPGSPHHVSASAVPGSGQIVLQLKSKSGSPIANGRLAVLVFQAKQPGKSSLVIQPPKMSDSKGKPLPITAQHGQIQIQ